MAFTKIIELGAARVPVGLTDGARWADRDAEGKASALEDPFPPFMVTLLDLGPRGTVRELITGLESNGLSSQLVLTFPVAGAVRLDLSWPSAYWQERALRWLQEADTAREHAGELRRLARNGLSQRARHVAARLAPRDS